MLDQPFEPRAIMAENYLPEYDRDGVKISRFTIDRDAAIRGMFAYGSRAPSAGTYTRLHIDGALWMSNTDAEIYDHLGFVRGAMGRVLITGLGLGMAIRACALKPGVESVDVIERDPRVISAVAPHLPDSVNIIHADATEWKPAKGQTWDHIWHDIWISICEDDKPERNRLKRKFSRRFTGHQAAWGDREMRELSRRSRGYW